MNRLRVLTKLKPLEILGVLLFLFFTVCTAVMIHSWQSIATYVHITDSWLNAIPFTLSLMMALPSLFSFGGAVMLALLGLLLGLNIVLLIQYAVLQKSLTTHKPKVSAVHTVTGLIATVLGIGCAACGSAILFALLSIFGAGGLIVLLPLHGNEFGVIGLIVLTYSNWILLGKLNNPYICNV